MLPESMTDRELLIRISTQLESMHEQVERHFADDKFSFANIHDRLGNIEGHTESEREGKWLTAEGPFITNINTRLRALEQFRWALLGGVAALTVAFNWMASIIPWGFLSRNK